ncbi:MAG TPA: YncE family protein [Candidatus Sulfotelmatobacter sp.]|nr:YncE family protein [Candidatus Sulfotelmatobacter sp.]
MKNRFSIILGILVLTVSSFVKGAAAQEAAPLKLATTVPLPAIKEGDFDHFGKDIEGNRFFLTGEANGSVEIFDSKSNKHIHSITGMKSPHALLYRADTKKLFVVDGDDSQVKVYDGTTYQLLGHITLLLDADSMAYDSATKYMYVVNGGREAKTPYSFITAIDTNTSTKVRDIKIDTNWIEALLLEKSGPRMFCVLTAQNAIGVMDRTANSLSDTWHLPAEDKHPVSLGFDEPNHRLFVAIQNPGKLVVLNSDNGKVVAELPAPSLVDDLAFDPEMKRIYLSGDGFLNVYSQKDPDHYSVLAKIPTGFRAKTGMLVPEWKHYYLAAPSHQKRPAEVRVYDVQ